MAHAMCAYFGYKKGYEFIDECIKDSEIKENVSAAMKDTALALAKQYNISLDEIHDNIYDLVKRFNNEVLGDTVFRVGKDPIRKLGKNDRLIGAALYCVSQGVNPKNIIKGIVAGLKYDNKNDESAIIIQSLIKDKGLKQCLKQICGINEETELFNNILKAYEEN